MRLQMGLVSKRYRTGITLVQQTTLFLVLPTALHVQVQSPPALQESMTGFTLDSLHVHLNLTTNLLVSIPVNCTVEFLVAKLPTFERLDSFVLVEMCIKHLRSYERN